MLMDNDQNAIYSTDTALEWAHEHGLDLSHPQDACDFAICLLTQTQNGACGLELTRAGEMFVDAMEMKQGYVIFDLDEESVDANRLNTLLEREDDIDEEIIDIAANMKNRVDAARAKMME